MFAASLLFLALEAAADLFQPGFMALIVDKGVSSASPAAILRYGGVMLAVAAAGALAAVMRNWLSCRTSQLVAAELRAGLYAAVQRLPLEAAGRLGTPSLITRVTSDVSQVQNFIQGCMRVLVKAPMTCVGAVAMIAFQAPERLPVLGCVVLAALALTALNMKLGYARFGAVQEKMDALNGASRGFLASVRTVRAFGADEREALRFAAAAGELRSASVRAMRLTAAFMPLINLTANFGILALLYQARVQPGSGVGGLMASLSYMTQILFSLTMFSGLFDRAVRANVSASRIAEVLDSPRENRPARPLHLDGTGAVEFDHVSFAWPGAKAEALSDVSFSLSAGETLGVIGPTGAGKTTLALLIPRIYEPTSGTVRVGGTDASLLDPAELRQAVALVPQKSLLFTGTIMENLRWGREDSSLDEVREAARAACALDFIEALPDGFGTRLGQGGVNLSGGQRQRLCLARALLRRPRVFVLDDCTSALDAETESRVLAALRQQTGVTVILISARVCAVRKADRVLCLENGRVLGLAPHELLKRDCAEYRAICRSQIGGDIDG